MGRVMEVQGVSWRGMRGKAAAAAGVFSCLLRKENIYAHTYMTYKAV